MKRKTYSSEFKEQALRKARERGDRTLPHIAQELNLSLGTLKNWLKESGATQGHALPTNTPASTWNAAQRLSALLESHALKDQALHAWCRENGLFEHQLRQWQSEFCKIDKPAAAPADAALRQAKQKSDQLERELRRKDKALAEAAALLVLQKKFQALWEEEEK
jgi:transposase-like protein